MTIEDEAAALAAEIVDDPALVPAFRDLLMNHARAALHAARFKIEIQLDAPFQPANVVAMYFNGLPSGQSYQVPDLITIDPPFTSDNDLGNSTP